MKTSASIFPHSYRLLAAIGVLSLGAMLTFQAFGIEAAASANSRDEFPGRRQGGGTHWVMPADTAH